MTDDTLKKIGNDFLFVLNITQTHVRSPHALNNWHYDITHHDYRRFNPHLAKKKIFHALIALYYEDYLLENFIFCSYAHNKPIDEDTESKNLKDSIMVDPKVEEL